ncbi:glycoside hydrolase family 5 protein [Niveibacterium sp. 24ML]|uniref:glycoside hydrolase family 5 protein n=1 Tax=Niveibacterium sp. 24ML TaxID=2985512 RepID=UPI00226EC81B|nr:glycoside hydrolase family 5 protein [Niveibacterium sp. 24ML]MCX9156355.1 glycoside hydrolase family 5 protein [Niveibacterium sp. 24ML]
MKNAKGAIRMALLAAAASTLLGCGGGAEVTIGPVGPSPVPDINAYPPMPNNAAPGASASALAAAAAIGRGVNFGNMLEAPVEGAWGVTLTDDFIDKVAAAGFESVRLPVRWSNHAGASAPYTIDPAFMARVESVVDKLLAKGLVVVLNMHHYRQLDGDPLDIGEFRVEPAALDVRFVMMWQQIATRFKDRSGKLLFELYNEPHGRINGEAWNVLAARTLGVVRKTNPARVVVIGPTSWHNASDLRLLKMPNDANLIATIHNYAPFNFTHQGADWISPPLPLGVKCCSNAQRAEMLAPLDTARSWSNTTRYPVFVGEFGAFGKADEASRIAFNRTMRDAMEARGMSWSYWEFAAGFGVYDPVSLTFRQGLLDSLLAP